MTEHLSYPNLNSLVDGELSADQLAMANIHLSQCPSCTSDALRHSLLKSAMGKAGQRYLPASDFQARLLRRLREDHSQEAASRHFMVGLPLLPCFWSASELFSFNISGAGRQSLLRSMPHLPQKYVTSTLLLSPKTRRRK